MGDYFNDYLVEVRLILSIHVVISLEIVPVRYTFLSQ